MSTPHSISRVTRDSAAICFIDSSSFELYDARQIPHPQQHRVHTCALRKDSDVLTAVFRKVCSVKPAGYSALVSARGTAGRDHAAPRGPFFALHDYVLLADGERGAIVGPRGDIGWMCAPRWDSASIFSALIGGVGTYSVTPVEPFVWGGCYDDGSLIWTNRWTTRTGTILCRDALAFPGDAHRAVLLRRVCAVDAATALDVTLRPRGGYDRHPLTDVHRQAGAWSGRCGQLHLRWSGAAAACSYDGGERLSLHLELEQGQQHDLVLEISDRPLPPALVVAEDAWRATEEAWQAAVPKLENCLSAREARTSYAVLRALTSETGGMVAAATTSLPERAEAGRNYDYRYVWIRDQCFAGIAAAAIDDDTLLDAAVEFVTARVLEHGDHLAPAYTSVGEACPATAAPGSAWLPRRFRHRWQPRQASVSARRFRRGAPAVCRRCRPRPPGTAPLESGAGGGGSDRASMART